MAYSTVDTLNKNIRALSVALGYQKSGLLPDDGALALKEYAGFGGLKAILYPEGDLTSWIKSGASNADLNLHPHVQKLHRLLRENLDGKAYEEALSSLKNSVLTAFYTPSFVPETIYQVLKDNGIQPKKLYEPSAGSGIFISEAIKAFPSLTNITSVEKDLLTGMVLTALNSTNHVKTTTKIKQLMKMAGLIWWPAIYHSVISQSMIPGTGIRRLLEKSTTIFLPRDWTSWQRAASWPISLQMAF